MICQVEIVDNLLKEEKQMKKRYQQQPQLWPEKQRDRVKVTNEWLPLMFRGFIKVFNRRATEFDTRAKNWQGPEGLDP